MYKTADQLREEIAETKADMKLFKKPSPHYRAQLKKLEAALKMREFQGTA
jgi:hypothetical protein